MTNINSLHFFFHSKKKSSYIILFLAWVLLVNCLMRLKASLLFFKNRHKEIFRIITWNCYTQGVLHYFYHLYLYFDRRLHFIPFEFWTEKKISSEKWYYVKNNHKNFKCCLETHIYIFFFVCGEKLYCTVKKIHLFTLSYRPFLNKQFLYCQTTSFFR